MDNVIDRLERIEVLIKEQNLSQKKVLNVVEATQYLGISESHLYKLTSSARIPFYKPNGKLIYFQREELEEWALCKRVSTRKEVAQKALTFKIGKGGAS